MPFKKISDYSNGFYARPKCLSRDHYPPVAISLAPGYYEYTCPTCGHMTPVSVPSTPYCANEVELERKDRDF